MRLTFSLLLALVATAVAGCGGGDDPPSPPGSPENPLVAQSAEPGAAAGEPGVAAAEPGVAAAEPGAGAAKPGATAPAGKSESGPTQKPGYEALVDRQSRNPRTRFTPCDLVTAAQAGAILGAPVRAPVEALQGPTCIYQTRDGDGFVALAVQATPFDRLKRSMRGLRRVQVSDHAAYCGTYGQSMLYVPLSKGRVLSVAAPCTLAQGFAARAMRQLAA
jgi:hypothetical protein